MTNVNFQGFMEAVTTFQTSETEAGAPVKMSANNTVARAADGDAFIGVSLNVRGGVSAVQTHGYIELAYSGTVPAVGFKLLAADASGGVKTVTTGGRECLIVNVDTAAKTVGFMM